MTDIELMAVRASERLHRSIGQKARYAKAMLAFDVSQELARIATRPPLLPVAPVFWYGIAEAAITDERIGRRRWDVDQDSSTTQGERHGESQEARQAGEACRQGQENRLLVSAVE
jgi:hypothetical protein